MDGLRALIPALLVAVTAPDAFAGAWLQKPGDTMLITQATYFSGDEYFDIDGSRQPQPRFSKWELQPYIEHGLNEWLTLGGSVYLQQVSQSDHSNYGIGDPEFFARVGLMHSATYGELALQPMVKFPSIYHDSGTPRGASRATDVELNLLWGMNYEIFDARDYVDTRVGYRERGRGLKPQWKLDASFGTYVSDALQIIPAIRYTAVAQSVTASPFSQNGEQDFDLLKAELTAAYHLDETQWVHATLFEHLAGSQTGAGTGLSLGYGTRF